MVARASGALGARNPDRRDHRLLPAGTPPPVLAIVLCRRAGSSTGFPSDSAFAVPATALGGSVHRLRRVEHHRRHRRTDLPLGEAGATVHRWRDHPGLRHRQSDRGLPRRGQSAQRPPPSCGADEVHRETQALPHGGECRHDKHIDRDRGCPQWVKGQGIRPDFLPVLDRWAAAVKAGESPGGVFEDKDYLAEQFASYEATVAAAEQATRDSQGAGEVADAYVGTTILLATALFFAGVTSSFRYRPARLLLLIAATGAVAAAAARIAGLPVA